MYVLTTDEDSVYCADKGVRVIHIFPSLLYHDKDTRSCMYARMYLETSFLQYSAVDENDAKVEL